MNKIFLLVLIIISFNIKAQVNQFQNGHHVETDQEVYKEGFSQDHKVLIIPFDSKMYISSVDRYIAEKTGLSYAQIRDNMRHGLCDQLLLKAKENNPAISIIDHDAASVYNDLNYIYNSIGYKYKLVPIKENTTENAQPETKLEKFKHSINKLVKKDKEVSNSNKEYESGSIKNGQIYTVQDYEDRYMHTSIHNPNLLNTLSQKYHTDIYLFINELDIEESKSNYNNNSLSSGSYRKVKVHYTVFNQKGVELDGGAATSYIPTYINDMNRIINSYFSKIAQEICSSIPLPVLLKHEIEKKEEEQENANAQRSEIEKY